MRTYITISILLCSFTSHGQTHVHKKSSTPSTQAECEKAGGKWSQFGMIEKYLCNLPTKDAGKLCRDNSECESVCTTDDKVKAGAKTSGKCFHQTVTLGTCLNLVIAGKATGTACED